MSQPETTTHPSAPEVAELVDTAPAPEPAQEPAEPPLPRPRASTWRDGVTGQLEFVWQGLRARDNSRHRPEHAAPPDQRAERIAAAGMGLLVLVGAIVTYVVVVGAIDPLLARAPAGGAPPTVVRSVTPTPTPAPSTAESAVVGASAEPNGPRTRSRVTAPVTPRSSVPTPTTTTTPPTTTSPPASPTPSPSG